MELVLGRKNVKWIDDLRARLFEALEDKVEEVEEVEEEQICEHFSYKKTLLFYTCDCSCCRYAQAVKDASGQRDYICCCAAKQAENKAV